MTKRWLELDDDGDIILVIDRGDREDQETCVVRDDYELGPRLQDEWHRLDAERQDARAFGAACVAEAVGTYQTTRGRFS